MPNSIERTNSSHSRPKSAAVTVGLSTVGGAAAEILTSLPSPKIWLAAGAVVAIVEGGNIGNILKERRDKKRRGNNRAATDVPQQAEPPKSTINPEEDELTRIMQFKLKELLEGGQPVRRQESPVSSSPTMNGSRQEFPPPIPPSPMNGLSREGSVTLPPDIEQEVDALNSLFLSTSTGNGNGGLSRQELPQFADQSQAPLGEDTTKVRRVNGAVAPGVDGLTPRRQPVEQAAPAEDPPTTTVRRVGVEEVGTETGVIGMPMRMHTLGVLINTRAERIRVQKRGGFRERNDQVGLDAYNEDPFVTALEIASSDPRLSYADVQEYLAFMTNNGMPPPHIL